MNFKLLQKSLIMSKEKSGGDDSPYQAVEFINATGSAFISFPEISGSSDWLIKIDMKTNSTNTRFYHGFDSYEGQMVTCHASAYRFMITVHEWQQASLANSDARIRQIVEYNANVPNVTLTTDIVSGSLTRSNVNSVSGKFFTLFSSVAASYGYKGGCNVYGMTCSNLTSGEEFIFEPVIEKATGAVGMVDRARNKFYTNSSNVGEIITT